MGIWYVRVQNAVSSGADSYRMLENSLSMPKDGCPVGNIQLGGEGPHGDDVDRVVADPKGVEDGWRWLGCNQKIGQAIVVDLDVPQVPALYRPSVRQSPTMMVHRELSSQPNR